MKIMIKKYFKHIITFFQNDIWKIDIKTLNIFYKALIYIYKILFFSVKDFIKNRCSLWAAAITYFVLLSFIPISSVLLFIAKVFNLYSYILNGVLDIVNQYAPNYEAFIRQVFSFMQNINLSNYGIIGLVSTIVSMILLLMNIQRCLMNIWNVKRTSSLPRLIADYIALIIISPVIIGILFALVAYSKIAVFQLPAIIRILFSMVMPIAVLWFLLLLLYVLIPPTKVLWRGAMLSSLIAAAIIIAILNSYFRYNIGVQKYEGLFDSQSNYVEYKIESINTSATDYTQYSEGGSNFIISQNSPFYNNLKNDNTDRAPISILKTEYIRENTNTTNILRDDKYTINSKSVTMNFYKFSDTALQQIVQSNFKSGDNVLITYSNAELLSISPQGFLSDKTLVQIPILLVLVYICSNIILFGAELNHSYQSMRLYSSDISNSKMSIKEREIIAFTILSDIVTVFINNAAPLSLSELAQKYKMYPEQVEQMLECFVNNKYIISFIDNRIHKYTLGSSPQKMMVKDLLDIFREYNGNTEKINGNYYIKILESNKKKLSKMSLLDAINEINKNKTK